MDDMFTRSRALLGVEKLNTLKNSHVCVVGIGGVGGYAVETLARAGVFNLTLVDHDVFTGSNLNRQLHALGSTLGASKAQSARDRVLQINPEANVRALEVMYTAQTRGQIFDRSYDYIIDAIDLVTHKLDLIQTAISENIPIISALGTGNKLDAGRLSVTDISKTHGCPLARVMRKELRDRGINHLTVVFSDEEKRQKSPIDEQGGKFVPSIPWVPAVAGILLAQHVCRNLTGEL